MDSKVAQLINQQINAELYSAYLYLDFSNYYRAAGLDGFAGWYIEQAKEEMDHAHKFYDYLHDNDVPVVLEAIAKPDKTFTDPVQPLEAGYEHEKLVTSMIDKIYAAAVKAKDYRTSVFLEWFISEQSEEEKNARDLLTKMKLFGQDSLYHIDHEMAKRD